jgi:hypothetical protein
MPTKVPNEMDVRLLCSLLAVGLLTVGACESRATSGVGNRADAQVADFQQGQTPLSVEADTTDDGVGIGGFVLNETFSVVGRNFYDAFYGAWTEPDDASLYTVYVREEPTPQFGARVIVEVGDTKIFQTFLRPNARRTTKAARQAAQRTELYVREYHEPRDVY